MKGKMPVLFIGHGSPMNIIEDNTYTRSLSALGKSLPQPEAIMVVSAHWLTNGTSVTCVERPKTIYDFYGFPKELYRITYPSPGAPDLAKKVATITRKHPVTCSSSWGLDHASWAVLKHIYPKADIPVFEMSLDYTFNDWSPKPVQYHYDLGAEFAGLRDQGILIIGSGNIAHNLGIADFENIDAATFEWAGEFDEAVKKNLLDRDHQGLIDFMSMGKTASLAVPTLDHYLPMIYAISLREKNEPLTFIHEGFQYGSISMRSFRIG